MTSIWVEAKPKKKKGLVHHCAYCGGPHPGNVCENKTAKTPSLVDLLVKEKGITKWRAYDILAQERKAGIDSWEARGLKRPEQKGILPSQKTGEPEPVEVPQNHRMAILIALSQFKEARTLRVLRVKLLELGFVSDDHNIAHVLWALQKENLVRFTERKVSGGFTGSGLEHIALRPEGRKKVEEFKRAREITETIVEPEPVKESIVEPETIQSSVKETVVEPELVPEPVKETKPAAELDFPLIRAIVNRQIKMNAAARLLEEAGQDDLAISVLEKAIYSPLETEIIALWRKVKM